ncbi:hypothetical protein [Dokdonella sp.]|uniref:hypothetical protein n=1 Tax=Dokdonella sp. TaxID=2291710 RepID=UPI003C38BDE6
MRTFLRRTAWFFLGFIAVYLVAGNVFLNSPIGEWAINRKPEKFQLHWSHGVTWWPGYATLWNVKVNGHVRHVLWNAETPRGRARIAILPLFKKELDMPWIEADVVTGEVAHTAVDMPPPPYRPGGWTIRLEHIRSNQIEHAKVVGIDIDLDGSADFGFAKQLRDGPWEILPTSFDLRSVRVRHDNKELLHDGHFSGGFSIASHTHREVSGLATLKLLDVRLRMESELPAVEVDLDSSGHWHGAIAKAGKPGRLDVDLVWERGRFANGGHVDVNVPLFAKSSAMQFEAAASLRARVEQGGYSLEADLPAPPDGLGSAHARLFYEQPESIDPPDAKEALRRTSGTLVLDWRFKSLDWLGPLLVKTPWLKLQGAGRIDADLKLRSGKLEPGSRVDVPEVELVAMVAGHRFHGMAKTHGLMRADALVSEGATGQEVSVDFSLDEFDIVAEDEPEKMLASGRDLQIRLDSQGDLAHFRDKLLASLRFGKAEVPDLRALNVYLPANTVQFLGGSTALSSDLTLNEAGHVTRGQVGLDATAVQAQFGTIRLTTDIKLDAQLAGTDIKQRLFDLNNSSLKLSRVKVVDDGRTAGQSWWANIALDGGRIVAKRPLNIDANVRTQMKDVGLLLAVFTRHKDYPKWVLKLINKGELKASGRLQMRDRTLIIDPLQSENDRLDVEARLQLGAAGTDGDLLIHWGLLSLGVELEQNKHKFHLMHAKEWFAKQPALLPASN